VIGSELQRQNTMKTLTILPLLTGLTAATFALEADYAPPAPGSYSLPVIKAAADGALLDHKGRPVRLADLTLGRITVMSFIYTRCSDAKACPYATGVLLDLHRASAEDAELAEAMRLVSMSFDPVNDTPQRMADFSAIAEERPQAAPWHFVTAPSVRELAPVLAAYGQAVDKKRNASDPLGPLNHTLRVFLVDAAGCIRNIYSSGTLDLRLVLADVRTLMLESPPALTPAEAVNHPGETVKVSFKVESAAHVTDITDRDDPQPVEVLLLDGRNDGGPATPSELASVVVQIPVTAFGEFEARDAAELVRRFSGKTVTVAGEVRTEPHPLRHGGEGRAQSRVRMVVTDPSQIAIHSRP